MPQTNQRLDVTTQRRLGEGEELLLGDGFRRSGNRRPDPGFARRSRWPTGPGWTSDPAPAGPSGGAGRCAGKGRLEGDGGGGRRRGRISARPVVAEDQGRSRRGDRGSRHSCEGYRRPSAARSEHARPSRISRFWAGTPQRFTSARCLAWGKRPGVGGEGPPEAAPADALGASGQPRLSVPATLAGSTAAFRRASALF